MFFLDHPVHIPFPKTVLMVLFIYMYTGLIFVTMSLFLELFFCCFFLFAIYLLELRFLIMTTVLRVFSLIPIY